MVLCRRERERESEKESVKMCALGRYGRVLPGHSGHGVVLTSSELVGRKRGSSRSATRRRASSRRVAFRNGTSQPVISICALSCEFCVE